MKLYVPLCAVLFFVGGCAPSGSVSTPTPTESVTADSPHQTTAGNRFVVPAGWTVQVEGPATIVTAPEGEPRRNGVVRDHHPWHRWFGDSGGADEGWREDPHLPRRAARVRV